MTFPTKDQDSIVEASKQAFLMPEVTKKFLKSDDRKTLDPDDPAFKNAKWCYDTPGVVHRDQVCRILI